MPLKIFSRRNAVYFTLGITALLTFWEWVAAEIEVQSPLSDNLTAMTAGNTMSILVTLAVGVEQVVTAYAADNLPATPLQILENKIRHKIVVDKNVLDSSYNDEAQGKDINSIVSAMLNMYQNSKLNKCKIDAFIQGSYKINVSANFVKKLSSHHSASSSDFFMYQPSERTIYVLSRLYRLAPSILMQGISHELRHLLDADNNEKNKVWPSISKAGKHFFQTRPWGNPKKLSSFFDEDQDIDAQWNLVSSVDTDLSRIIRLHQAILKPIEKQTKVEQIQLRKLMTLVKESNYLPTKIDRTISSEATDFFKKQFHDDYNYNAEQDKYIAKREDSMIILDDKISLSTPEKSEVVDIKYHVLEYSTGPHAFWLTTYTNIHKHTLEDLTKDLLLNIRVKFDFIQKNYRPIQQLNEFGAYLDQITSDYPKLREYLFPLLTNHEEKRFSTELRACLN